MYLKRLSVRKFITESSSLWIELTDTFKLVYGYKPTDSEINSWRVSLPELAEVFRKTQDTVQKCEVLIEYGMPGSSCRADIVLVGRDIHGYRTAIIVELKQWDARSIIIDGQNVKIGGQIHSHPSQQALDYVDYLADLSVAFADHQYSLNSCSYLHNALRQNVLNLNRIQFEKLVKISPLFTRDQSHKMAEWISSILIQEPDSYFISDLENSEVKVSKRLFDQVASSIREQPVWSLLEEQTAAKNQIVDLIDNRDEDKHLVLVTGGPGTGKSIIAMQIMGILNRRQIKTVHITNSSSFTTVTRALIQERGNRIWGTKAVENLFRLSHNWVKRKDQFEVAICDEAHRFRLTTDFRPNLYSLRPQAEEIMENVRVLVAFVDEKQILRKAEQGTLDYFRECAINVGVKAENIHGPVELKAQFRNAGNSDFVKALDEALYSENQLGFNHRNFEVTLHKDPVEMENYLQDRIDQGYSARLVAGFCWPWSDPQLDGSLVGDVVINDWSRAWNRKAIGNTTSATHPYTQWATRKEKQLSEVGCIYSVQGFEFDYIGVIWGFDLVRRGNTWIAQPGNSCDGEMRKRVHPIESEIALPLLKNAYRVLSSRGLRGCAIYCQDEETSFYLKSALLEEQ